MKRILLGTTMVLAALNGFAQGIVSFNNLVAGQVKAHVYAPLASNPLFPQIGNGTADFPAGTTDWAAFSKVGVTLGGQFGASTTFAQLLVAPGLNAPESSLIPASPTVTFRTGLRAGFTEGGVVATANNVLPDDGPATVEMVAWDNSSGLYPTWTQAFPAWAKGLIAAGESGRFNLGALGGFNPPPFLIGLQSFNLWILPEPSTFALLGLGAAMLMIARRRR